MMGKDQISSAEMDVDGVAEFFTNHRRTFDVPSGASVAPGGWKAWLIDFCAFPKGEIKGVPLACFFRIGDAVASRDIHAAVLEALLAAPEALMLALNETAHHEIRRLEAQRDEESAVHLPRWHRIIRRVGSMDEGKLKQTLREELGASYGGGTSIDLYEIPRDTISALVSASLFGVGALAVVSGVSAAAVSAPGGLDRDLVAAHLAVLGRD